MGKAFFATLENLTNENGEELTVSDIFDGNNVIYECSDGKSYDVTIREASGISVWNNVSYFTPH